MVIDIEEPTVEIEGLVSHLGARIDQLLVRDDRILTARHAEIAANEVTGRYYGAEDEESFENS